MRAVLALVLALFALSGLSACDDDDPTRPPAPTTGVLIGWIVAAETGGPLGPFAVALLERATMAPVGRTVSDERSGRFEFTQVPPGDYLPLVLSNGWSLAHLPRPTWTITAGDTLRDTFAMEAIAPLRDDGVRIEGQVVDDATGEPIAFARIEMNFISAEARVNWSDYRGEATTLEPIADAEGRFVLEPVPLVFDPSNNRFLAPSWRVSAPGYRSVSFAETEDFRVPLNITVRLVPGADPGVITGLVVDLDSQPVPGCPVAVEWRRGEGAFLKGASLEAAFDKALLPTGIATTDAAGAYRIEGLPRGAFNLRAGPYRDDGFTGSIVTGVEIGAPLDSTFAPTLLAVEALRQLAPADGTTVSAPPLLEWEADPRAASYFLSVRRVRDGAEQNFRLPDTSFQLPANSPLLNGPAELIWGLLAFDAQGADVNATERPWAVRFAPEPE